MNKGQLIFGLIDFIIVINYTENITVFKTNSNVFSMWFGRFTSHNTIANKRLHAVLALKQNGRDLTEL